MAQGRALTLRRVNPSSESGRFGRDGWRSRGAWVLESLRTRSRGIRTTFTKLTVRPLIPFHPKPGLSLNLSMNTQQYVSSSDRSKCSPNFTFTSTSFLLVHPSHSPEAETWWPGGRSCWVEARLYDLWPQLGGVLFDSSGMNPPCPATTTTARSTRDREAFRAWERMESKEQQPQLWMAELLYDAVSTRKHTKFCFWRPDIWLIWTEELEQSFQPELHFDLHVFWLFL